MHLSTDWAERHWSCTPFVYRSGNLPGGVYCGTQAEFVHFGMCRRMIAPVATEVVAQRSVGSTGYCQPSRL
eukprot:4010240-Alexandrium_andersonii.AAC.1